MGALLTLATRDVAVQPGAVAQLILTVKNTGTVVDQFAIDVLGDASAFAAAEPPTLSLFPGADGSTTIFFRPPRLATTPAGALPFGIRARSHEDPAGSAVEEGVLTVGSFQDTYAELVPRTSHASRGANHELALDNRGNARLNATVTAADPDQLLAFDIQPPGLVVSPGTAGFSKVRVKPSKRFWRGQPKMRPFKVAVAAEGGPPMVLDGSLLQEAVLPRWLVPALMALLAALVLAAILWLTVLQPAIKSAATQAMADAGFTPKPSPAASSGGASAAPSTGSGGSSPSPAPSGGGGAPSPSAGSASPSPGSGGVGGLPSDGRLSMDGTNQPSATFATTYYLTDLVFANPNGRSGTLQLKRDSFVLITLRLENFRDLDFHYVTPILVQPKQVLSLTVTCTSGSPCDPSVYYSGFSRP